MIPATINVREHTLSGFIVIQPNGKRSDDTVFQTRTDAARHTETLCGSTHNEPHWFDLAELGWRIVPVRVTATELDS